MENISIPPKLRPLGTRVLIRQDAAEKKIGSIWLPDGKEEWPAYGEVLAVGMKVPSEADPVKPGDRVYFKRKPSTAVNPDTREGDPEGWKDLLMMELDDIMAVV